MPDTQVHIDHLYIEERNVAERYVSRRLSREELELFERHYVDCAECMDRLALAEMFRIEEKPKPQPFGLFTVLADFTPAQQTLIFAVAALLLVVVPVVGMNWWEQHLLASPIAAAEPVIWLNPTVRAEVRVPPETKWVTIAVSADGVPGMFRLSVVDVNAQPIWSSPDQNLPKGTVLGLRVPSLPTGLCYVQVERRAPNGSYSVVARHELVVEWK